MRAGRLQHQITLQKPVAGGKDALGAPIETWTDVDIVWADLSPASMASPRGAARMVLDAAVYGLDPKIVTFYPYPGVDIGWRFLYYNAFSDLVEIYEIKAYRENNAGDLACFIAAMVTQGTT